MSVEPDQAPWTMMVPIRDQDRKAEKIRAGKQGQTDHLLRQSEQVRQIHRHRDRVDQSRGTRSKESRELGTTQQEQRAFRW